MVTVSCSGKFHAFALVEQLAKAGMLDRFYTTYAYQKDRFTRKFAKRRDLEAIPAERIFTKPWLAVLLKLFQNQAFQWNHIFDAWVAAKLRRSDSKVFIGWSGMSLNSMKVARSRNMFTILERGSSHIQYQDKILRDEYSALGKSFRIDPAVIRKELQEYDLCDMISIPSTFVKTSFIEYGISEKKLFLNPYGVNKMFEGTNIQRISGKKFSIVYFGRLNIRKGLIYLFKALWELPIPEMAYTVHFIGSVDDEMEEFIAKWKKPNWIFHGQIDHYDLPRFLEGMDVAVLPSLEDGFGMVIPQLMSCGIPVIASTNTGGPDIIENGKSGIIIPVRSEEHIRSAILKLFQAPEIREQMGNAARDVTQNRFSWNDYGDRYLNLLKDIL